MPTPISLATFQQVATQHPDNALRLDGQDTLTTAPRGFGGRLIQYLKPGSERAARQHIATELLRRLEDTYGKQLAREAFRSVRRDLSAREDPDSFRIASKPLTARQVRDILQTAQGLSRQQQDAEKLAVLRDYAPDAPIIATLAADRHAQLENMTPEHWMMFERQLTEFVRDAQASTGANPPDSEMRRTAGKLLAHLSRQGPEHLKASAQARVDVARTGQALMDALAGRPSAPESAPALLASLFAVTRGDNAYTRDLGLGARSEIGGDDLHTMDRMALNLAISSLSPAIAGRLLQSIRAEGSPYRQLLMSCQLCQSDPGNGLHRKPALTAISGALQMIDQLLSHRAGAPTDVGAFQDAYGAATALALDTDWEQTTGPGLAPQALREARAGSMDGLRACIAQLRGPVTAIADQFAQAEVSEIEAISVFKRQYRTQMRETIGETLLALTRTRESQISMHPDLRTLLQDLGRELLTNENVHFGEIVKALRVAGLNFGQGLLQEIQLSATEVRDLALPEQKEPPLPINYMNQLPAMVVRNDPTANQLLKDYMIYVYGWSDRHPDESGHLHANVRDLHEMLATARTEDGGVDFAVVLRAFALSGIPIDKEEFRPLTEQLMRYFPPPVGAE